jgi:hypothetical protein
MKVKVYKLASITPDGKHHTTQWNSDETRTAEHDRLASLGAHSFRYWEEMQTRLCLSTFQFVHFTEDDSDVAMLDAMDSTQARIDYLAQWDCGEYTEETKTWQELLELCGRITYESDDNYLVCRQCGGLNYSLYRIM